MNKKENQNLNNDKTTQSAEMVPSMFNWITPDFQKIRAKKLAEVTEKSQ